MYDKTVRRRRAVLALLVFFSLILITAYFSESRGGALHGVQRGALEVLAPIQEGANRALKPVRDLAGWVDDTLNAKDELDQVRSERDALRREVIGADSATRENAQLRRLVRLNERLSLQRMEPVTARVIGRSPTLWYATISVDKGTVDGVHVNQPVVNGDGLVGKVTDVTGHNAEVTLITDHTSGVSSAVNESGVTGVVRTAVGRPDDLLLDFVTRRARIRRGQRIVTSGTRSERLESLFPAGLPIGWVTRVDDREVDLFQRVHVRPYADLRRLDFVQVLTRPARDERADADLRAATP